MPAILAAVIPRKTEVTRVGAIRRGTRQRQENMLATSAAVMLRNLRGTMAAADIRSLGMNTPGVDILDIHRRVRRENTPAILGAVIPREIEATRAGDTRRQARQLRRQENTLATPAAVMLRNLQETMAAADIRSLAMNTPGVDILGIRRRARREDTPAILAEDIRRRTGATRVGDTRRQARQENTLAILAAVMFRSLRENMAAADTRSPGDIRRRAPCIRRDIRSQGTPTRPRNILRNDMRAYFRNISAEDIRGILPGYTGTPTNIRRPFRRPLLVNQALIK
jgi:hypothetical protein